MSILRDFYRGLLPIPAGRKPSTEQTGLQHKIDAEETAFIDSLTDDVAARYRSLCDMRECANSLSDADLFSYAFSLGLMIGSEIVGELEE